MKKHFFILIIATFWILGWSGYAAVTIYRVWQHNEYFISYKAASKGVEVSTNATILTTKGKITSENLFSEHTATIIERYNSHSKNKIDSIVITSIEHLR